MSIHKLPDYVINRLKAWEVIQRPASLLKELVENSLDAGATLLKININDGGKTYLSVEDNGSGIELSDMDLLLERYATSKINSDQDMYSLESYGFRWEALASIAEVSKISITTKTPYAEVGSKLIRRGNEDILQHVPVPFDHGTLVMVEDLFYNVPVRRKFLKSAQTEFYYCYNYFVDVALYHYDKAFILKKNDKLIFDLPPVRTLSERVMAIFKKDWEKNLIPLEKKQENIRLSGVVSDPSIRFGSGENIKIYVNARPVQDKMIRKAIMDAYARQITPGEYPLVVLMLNLDPQEVDVNVHPAKLQVKFLDTQTIYRMVYNELKEVLGENKIAAVGSDFIAAHAPSFPSQEAGEKDFSSFIEGMGSLSGQKRDAMQQERAVTQDALAFHQDAAPLSHLSSRDHEELGDQVYAHASFWDYQILGQLWNMYILLQSESSLYMIDQHALAERIAFEQMKKDQDLSKQALLQPLKFEIANIPELEKKIEELNELGFDIAHITENVIVVYGVPKVFLTYPIDILKLLNHVLYLETISFDHMLDGIYATKACKISIKAGHKLSHLQMKQLIQDGFDYIGGMFVCQHGRPFFVSMDKGDIDKLFDR